MYFVFIQKGTRKWMAENKINSHWNWCEFHCANLRTLNHSPRQVVWRSMTLFVVNKVIKICPNVIKICVFHRQLTSNIWLIGPHFECSHWPYFEDHVLLKKQHDPIIICNLEFKLLCLYTKFRIFLTMASHSIHRHSSKNSLS